MLNRYAALQRLTPVRKKRPGQARRGAPERDLSYLAWIRQQPCIVSGKYGVDAAHTKVLGRGTMVWKSPDRSAIPLRREYHREFDHGRRRPEFEAIYGVDIAAEVARLNAEYDAGQARQIRGVA